MRISTIQDCNIIIVQQDINQKFDNLFKKIKHNKVYIIKKKHPKKYNPNRKMILNGVKGFKFIFESLKSDICFYVEDDIALSGDAIKFGSSIIEKYKYDDNFFGVNFFSKMKHHKKTYDKHTSFMCSHINVGSSKDLTIKELAETIKEVVDFKGEIYFDHTKPDGNPRKLLNSKRINNLGFKPETSLIKGLKKTYQEYIKS